MRFERYYDCGCVEVSEGYYTALHKQCCPLTYQMNSPAELKCDRLNEYKREKKARIK